MARSRLRERAVADYYAKNPGGSLVACGEAIGMSPAMVRFHRHSLGLSKVAPLPGTLMTRLLRRRVAALRFIEANPGTSDRELAERFGLSLTTATKYRMAAVGPRSRNVAFKLAADTVKAREARLRAEDEASILGVLARVPGASTPEVVGAGSLGYTQTWKVLTRLRRAGRVRRELLQSQMGLTARWYVAASQSGPAASGVEVV